MDIDRQELGRYSSIIGCDEVGRGPIAGPVVGCAVRINANHKGILEALSELNITDSKKLSSKKRQIILRTLGINLDDIKLGVSVVVPYQKYSFSFCVCEKSHMEIDRINILQASLGAMKAASDNLVESTSKILIDGNKVFDSICDIDFVIKGDSKVLAIGLASIIAKEFRDEKMRELDIKYPGYNLAKHAGYPTKEHRDAVKQLGPCEIHRKTFKGVKEYLS